MIDPLNAFYVTLGFSVFFGCIGYVLGKQGVSGIEADVATVKSDITAIKDHIFGTGTTTVTTPVTGTVVTTTPVVTG